MFQKSLTACGSVCDMRLFDKGVRHETRRFVIAPSFVCRACDFWGWLGPSQLFLSVYFLFFGGGGSLPLRVYVLRPSALRAYAATPSECGVECGEWGVGR